MTDVLVIGAGIAGSSVARMARDRGLEVEHVTTPQPPASMAALAIIRRRWQHGEDLKRTDAALAWYRRINALVADRAVVTSQKDPYGKLEPDWYLIEPLAPLTSVPIRFDTIHSVDPVAQTATSEGVVYRAGLIVVAAGPASRLLFRRRGRPPFEERWGHTAVSTIAVPLPDHPLRVHWDRPYHAIIVGRSGGETRVGSSVARTPEKSLAAAEKLLQSAVANGMVSAAEDWQFRSGLRVMSDNGTSNGEPDWITRSCVVLTGFARCGYSIAPARAAEVLERRFGRE